MKEALADENQQGMQVNAKFFQVLARALGVQRGPYTPDEDGIPHDDDGNRADGRMIQTS